MGFLHYTVQDTIKMLMLKGLNFPEAVEEVEQKLRTKLPEIILNTIKEG